MKTIHRATFAALTLLLAAQAARAEYAIFDATTDSIALANGTTLGTTATIEAVFVPLSTANGAFYLEQVDGQEHKNLAISQTGVSGAALALPSVATGLAATTAVTLNVAHHLAFVRDGAEERLYLDGVRVISRTVTNADISDAANTAFAAAIGAGRYSGGGTTDPAFIGGLDSIRVSNIARYSGSSITPQTGDMATDANTLLLFNFDFADVTGNVVADLSGNGRHGTLGTTFPGATSPTISATATYPGTVWISGPDLAANEQPDGGPQELINPNATVPEWSYGTRTAVASTAFTPYTTAQHGNDISGYTNLDGWGNILVNTGTTPIDFTFAPRDLNPGVTYVHSHDTDIPVVRWTAPSTGTWLISASWLDLDSNGGDGVSCNVVVNGVSIFGTSIANGGNTATTQTIFVSAGSTVDFLVGKNVTIANDATAFNASITPAPAITHFTSTWNSTTGNWSDTTKWSTPGAPSTFPNNGSPSPTYDAVQSGGTLTVDVLAGVTIQKFTLNRATLTAANNITFNDLLTVAAPGPGSSTDFGPQNTLNGAGVIQANGGIAWSALINNTWVAKSEISGVNTTVTGGRTLATDVLNVTGGMTINGAAFKSLKTRALNHGDGVNPSTATWTAGEMQFSNNAVFTNRNGATFNSAFDGLMANSSGTNYFINEGTFSKSAGTGTTSISIVFDNSGTVNVDSGTLSLNGGGIHSGSLVIPAGKVLAFGGGGHALNAGTTFSGVGTVAQSGGTVTVNTSGTFHTGPLSLTGGTFTVNDSVTVPGPLNLSAPASGNINDVISQALNGPGTIQANGGMSWTANYGGGSLGFGVSEISGTSTAVIGGRTMATTALNVTGGMTLSGGGHKRLNMRAINHGDGVNASTANWTAGRIDFANAGVFTNKAGATFANSFDGLMQQGVGAGGTFINEGTFTKSGGTGATVIGTNPGNLENLRFISTGTVNVTSGTLQLSNSGGSTLTGTVNLAAGCGLRIANGTHVLDPGVTFTGAGTVTVTGDADTSITGVLTANGPVTFSGPLVIDGVAPGLNVGRRIRGTLNGPGVINVPAGMTWRSQGDPTYPIISLIQGSSANTAVVNGRTVATDVINVTGGLVIDGTNIKSLNCRSLNHGDGVNPSTATWTAGPIEIYNASAFTNKAAATFTTNFDGVIQAGTNATINQATFINQGTFTKNGGTGSTTFNNATLGFFNTGTVNASSGNIAFNGGYTQTGGALILNGGGVSAGTFAVSGGKIQGSGTITGAVTASSGVTIEPGIGSTTGTLAISGDLTLTSGSKLSFDIGGTAPGTQHDKLTEGGGSALNVNGVTLEVSLLGTFTPGVNDTFTVVDASGTAISGSFANVANGARLTLSGGLYSCTVNYGSATAFPGSGDKVVLSHFATGNVSNLHFTSTWNSTTGNWSDTTKWSTPGAPSTFPNNVTNPPITYDAVQNGGTLTVDLGGGITIEKLTMNGGVNTGGGAGFTLTLNDLMTWSAGTMNGSGTLNANGGMTMSGGATKDILSSRVINLSGTSTWSGGELRVYDTSSVLNNLAGGVLTTNVDAVMSGAGTFNNAGTFTKSVGTGSTTIGVTMTNSGTINVNSGTVRLTANGTHSGTLSVAGGTLQFVSGTHSLNAGTSFTGAGTVSLTGSTLTVNTAVTPGAGTAFNMSGGVINGAGTLTVNDPMTWSGGTMSGAGTLNANGGMTMSGGAYKDILSSRVINLSGTSTWSGGELRVYDTSSVLNNLAGGVLTTNVDAVMSGAGTFNNAGTFTKSTATGTTTFGVPVTNSGTVNANSGTILFSNSYTQTAGALVLNGGSVSSGTFTVRGGKIQGGGSISGGVNATGGSVHIEPGIGSSTGALFVSGDLTLTSGSKLSFDIGGIAAGTQHDQVTESGGSAPNLTGVTLEAALLGSYVPAPGDKFVLLVASHTPTTSFANVANGERLTLPGGLYSCQVNYGSSTAFPLDSGSRKVILSHFATTPTSLILDDNQIVENAPGGSTVGLLSATDPDTNETFTFSLTTVSGADPTDDDNGSFQITGNQLEAKSTTVLDFETKTSYKVRLRVTNSRGGFFEQPFTIQVLDVPAPTALALSNSSIFENQPVVPVPPVVGSFITTDPTPGATFTYALVSGANSSGNFRFNVNGADLRSSEVFDLESSATGPFPIRVRVTNNGGEFIEQNLSITVLNQGPSNLALAPSSILEGRDPGATVGTLSSTVVPEGTAVTYELVTGTGSTHNGQFEIVGTVVKTKEKLLFSEGATRSIRIRATGPATETVDQVFSITVINAGPPTDIALSASSIAENQPPDTVVGALSATDPDPEATLTFTLVDTPTFPDNARFNLNTDLGGITSLRTSQSFDKEAPVVADRGPFSIRLRVTNGANESYEETFTITVTDQGPAALQLSPSSILEGKANAPVGDLSVTTIVPAGTTISTWELVPGAADNTLFSLDGTTVKTTATALDFEAAPTRTVRVKATDANGESFTQDLAITVGDVALTDITLSGTTVKENLPAGTLIANLGAVISPADPAATPAFSIVSATPSGAVSVSGTQLVTARPLLRSTEPSIAVRLRTTHLDETYDEDVTITVNANAGSLRVENPPPTSITSLAFGDVVFGGNITRTVTLKNPGPGHVFNVSIRNPAAPLNDYVATSTELVADADLAPNESVTVSIVFTPQAYGNRNTTIVFESDNAPDKSLSVTGRGIGQEISVQQPLGVELVDGAPLDFGRQPFGVFSPAHTFVVRNVGLITSLTSIAATMTGPDAAFFVLDTQGLESTRAAGAGTSFRVKFQPEMNTLRTYNATLRVASNDADENPFDIPLTGEGVTPLLIAQTAYAKASDNSAAEGFGEGVAVSGNTVVVARSGNAYVFVRDPLSNSWSQEGPPLHTNRTAVWSVAISGDTIVLGNAGDSSGATGVNGDSSDTSAPFAGAAYVFQRSGGVWTQQAYLKASNTNAGDQFGGSVAISGDTIVVGAVAEASAATGINGDGNNNGAPGAGAAYVFQRSGGVWTQQAYLKASNTDASDEFGESVAIAGDTIVVGATGEDSAVTGVNGDGSNNSAPVAGAAYVFQRSGGLWSQQAYLKTSNTGAVDVFGISVGISGDTIVVGAARESSATLGVNGDGNNNGAPGAGAAYVFQRSGGAWAQQAYLKASNTGQEDHFGASVSISGDTIIVGAFNEDSADTGINGDANNNVAQAAGAAYVFQRSGGLWSEQSYLKASNTDPGDQFGQSVSISGDTIVVGARDEDSAATGINGDGSNNNAISSGAAYFFEIMAPQVIVHNGPDTGSPKLADNQAQAVDYGPTPLGVSVARSFTINNVRALPLTVSSITAPPGYSVVGAPTAPIPAQSSATFSVLLTGLTLGTNSGNVTITTNDGANPEFVFPVTGEVLTLAPGSLDPRFGANGVVRVDFGANDKAFDMLMLPEGRLVLGGERVASSVSQFALARLMPNGALDTSFDNDGMVSMTVPGVTSPSITGICLQDDKIVAVGTRLMENDWFDVPNQPSFALARYLPDGSLDSTFGTAGFDVDNSLTEGDFTWNIVKHPSGKLLVAGMVSGTLQAYIRRFNQNGGRDPGFGTNGTVLLSSGTYGGAVTVNAAGDVFAGGKASSASNIRLWKIGATTGIQVPLTLPKAAPAGYPVDTNSSDAEIATAVVLQADGKPVIAASRGGSFDRSVGHGFITGRATTSVAVDTTFNGTGVTIEDIDSLLNREQANSIAVQTDGKLVAVGQVGGKFVIVRYTTTGEIDPGFGTGGKVVLDLGANGSAYKVLLDGSGDIYVAGHASNGTNQDFVVVKLIGSVDHDPAIVVRNGSTSTSPVLVNGQASAVSFGSPRVGSSGITKSFLINNLGNGPLTIDSAIVPTGFQITSKPASVAAGSSAILSLKLKADTLGTFSGALTITTNDPAQPTFAFPITGTVVPNSAPTFSGMTISTVQGIPTTIDFSKILANASDANGDSLSITSLPATTTTGGATVALTDKASISYSPPVDLIGVDDFQVSITDGISTILGTITVTVSQDPALNPKNPPQVTVNATTGAITLTFSGLPNRNYTIQRSANLSKWFDIGTAKADKLGAITFTDPSPLLPSSFYRLKL